MLQRIRPDTRLQKVKSIHASVLISLKIKRTKRAMQAHNPDAIVHLQDS